jgi:DNA polymerase-3 subunit delta'
MNMMTFDDIFGQSQALDALRGAWRSERLPHGLIFAGPAGVGKFTTARVLGALLLCEKPTGGDQPCGRCASCVLMAAGNHPDFHVVYRQLIRLEKESSKARDLPIDVIRDFLLEPAGRTAVMNHGKVFVIKEAELMNVHAQNALLKNLEEPIGRTLIILLTDQPHGLLLTIRSRAQVVYFSTLDEPTVRRELEGRGIDPAIAAQAAQLTEGSLGMALRWIEDGIVTRALDLISRLDSLVAGKPCPDLAEWFRSAAEDYAVRQLKRDERASKDQATREGMKLYFQLAANALRHRLPESAGPAELEGLCAGIDRLVRAEQYVDSNVSAPLVLQQLAMGLDVIRPASQIA